jgi:hypothetical protein
MLDLSSLGVTGGPLEAFEVIHALLLIYPSIIEDEITNAMGTEEPQPTRNFTFPSTRHNQSEV